MNANRGLRSLIVTACPPPAPGDVHGIYRRLGMFITALGDISDTLEILHFTAPDAPTSTLAAHELNAMQSAHWGTPVQVTAVRQRAAPGEWWRYAVAAVDIGARPRYSPYTGPLQLAALRNCLARKPDIVFAHRLAGMVPLFRVGADLPPLFFDLDDVEHRVKLRAARAAGSALTTLLRLAQVPAIYRAERKAANMSRRTFVCSDEDRRYLARVGITNAVTVIPNAVAIPRNIPPLQPAPNILFLGGYHYEPNAQAAQRLITQIWPRIHRASPGARLLIAGGSPEAIPAYASRPAGVEFTGFVDDLAALYARTRMVCSPIDIGGGTRVKLIEAAAWGKPIVSTTIGAEGLALADGEEILIRDDDDAIARTCLQVLEDDALCRRIGNAARLQAHSTYELGAIRQRIREHVIAALR